MKLLIKILLVLAVVVAFTACESQSERTEVVAESNEAEVIFPADFESLALSQRVQFYLDNNLFNDALIALQGQDEDDIEIKNLKIATHMLYALELTYGSLTEQRTRMPEALRHYRRVLQLDPDNERAKAEIEQIESIYRSLNREIPQGVAE